MTDPSASLLSSILDALVATTDAATLRAELERRLTTTTSSSAHAQAARGGGASDEVLRRIVLSDMLGDDILGAKQEDKAFPLRMLFGDLAEQLASHESSPSAEAAFALASALNFYFRATLDEETRIGVGLATSRLYYAFMASRAKEAREVALTSPLLAALLSSELERSKLESVDHAKTFDGALHERAPGSAGSPTLLAPVSFLCRVAATGVVRSRALVRT